MNFQYYERMIVFGETQSGKTNFSIFLNRSLTRTFTYDIFKKNFHACGVVVTSWEQWEAEFRKGTPKIVVRWEDDCEEMFERWCSFLFDNAKHCTVFVDEVQEFTDANYTPKNFRRLIVMGQEEPRRIGVVSITQLPAQLSTKVRGNAQHKVSFYLNEENAIKACKNSGFNQLADELSKLKPYEFAYACPGKRIWKICPPVPKV